jgi:uncharacterized protein (DUF1501 family)
MCDDLQTTRRNFLRGGISASTLALAGGPFLAQMMQASGAIAQTASDYKALVCLYLGGGCDALSMVVPSDPTNFTSYRNNRQGLAIDKASLQPMIPRSAQNGMEAGFHPNLVQTAAMFAQRKVAVVSNVGALVQPVTKALLSAPVPPPLPPSLFSHVDQSAYWLQGGSEGSIKNGWGGKLADQLISQNQKPVLSAISAFYHSPLLPGQKVTQFTVSEYGAPANFISRGSIVEKLTTDSAGRSNLLAKSYAQVHERLRDGADDLSNGMAPLSAMPPGVPNTSIARQLQTIARIIAASSKLGMRRQVFYASLGGFDNHNGLSDDFPKNMTRLDGALAYFDQCLTTLNAQNNVTLFTASEFGRNLPANGDGTDHGWGGHHMVMGGAVKGGDIYGRLPTIGLQSESFTGDGQLIPQFSVEQYGATLGKWFGVSDTALLDVFPNLKNFNTRNLGFMV